MIVHVSRGRDGTRRLTEIAVLQRCDDGPVVARTAWQLDRGFGCGADELNRLIADRGVR